MNMKRSLILLCGLLTGFTLQSTKVNAQTQTVANDQKLVYPYTFAPSEGLVNQTEKEHRQEICINGYWDFQDFQDSRGIRDLQDETLDQVRDQNHQAE